MMWSCVTLLLSLCGFAESLSISRPGSPLSASKGAPTLNPAGHYLGLDLSTQSLTAVVVDADLDVVFRCSVNFDESLPEYRTTNGMNVKDEGVVTSPVAMWLDAVDEVMGQLEEARVLPQCEAISFSGQQHGSVYWTGDAASLLQGKQILSRNERHDEGFKTRLFPAAFSVEDSPIWADSSTEEQCEAMERKIAPARLADLTGSRAYARFTGPQIAAMAQRFPRKFGETSRVSLVSSFMASLFVGGIAPIDVSDASGTNLASIRGCEWNEEALAASSVPSDRLLRLLGKPVQSDTVVGTLAPWIKDRWGFSKPPLIIAGAGDNPSSAAGLGLSLPGDVALSMGTSDTYMAVTEEPKPQLEGHVFKSCTSHDQFYALLCYANGAASREKIRADYGMRSWDEFDSALRRGEPGNGGTVGMELTFREITPVIAKTGRWHAQLGPEEGQRTLLDTLDATGDAAAVAARAIVEGRFLSMRGRAAQLGADGAPRRVLATGGASKSLAIMQVAADVFGAPVLAADGNSDAAALGAAYRAAHGTLDGAVTFAEFLQSHDAGAAGLETVATPKAHEAYPQNLVDRYLEFERDVQTDKIR